jgi:hypothetical protein
MNFQYFPGLIGYGAKGADGSIGIHAMGLHYTDYDLEADIAIITNKIQSNESLFSTDLIGTPLPGRRRYINYESIVDNEGHITIITDASEGSYTDPPFPRFTTVTYFQDTSADAGDGVFDRYRNIFDISDPSATNYIIDNVYNLQRSGHLDYPSKIYGIKPKNFARVEYSNIPMNTIYNPFTVYSSGQYRYIDDHKAFSIVRNINSNTFRIGNDTSIRNTSLTFDISTLKKNSTPIRIDTTEGEILTNTEIGNNSLYNGFEIFTQTPISFYVSDGDVSSFEISWNLNDFTPASTAAVGNLYVYKDTLESFDPLIFYDVSTTGTATIRGLLENDIYYYHMNIVADGWQRTSAINSTTVGSLPTTSASPLTLDASADGTIYGSNLVTVTTDSATGWNLTVNSGWITPVTVISATQFSVGVAANTGGARSGTITITSQAQPVTVTVNQQAYVAPTITIDHTQVCTNPLNTLCSPAYPYRTITVTAPTGHRWYVIPSDSWVLISNGGSISSPRTGTGSFTVNCDKRTWTSDRLGSCEVKSLDGARSKLVGVNQVNDCDDCFYLAE